MSNLSNSSTRLLNVTINNVNRFKTHGMSHLEELSESSIEHMIRYANDQYYNTETAIMTDNEFDIIKEYMENKYPKNQILNIVGAEVIKNKVRLPYYMPSMDKIKPDTNALTKWKKKYNGPYLLSCKLDGVSGLYTTEGEQPKLYTRGNGEIGQDISYLLDVIKLPKIKNIVVRGEFILTKTIFNNKYKSKFANARNLVSGIINSKTIDSKSKNIDFIAYEVIKPNILPIEQMKLLTQCGFNTVQNTIFSDITNDLLSQMLIDWRNNYEYEIDGIIVTNNQKYTRLNKNPEHSFAFKMVISDQIAEAKVVDVIWQTSKNGYLKPKVQIEPVKLGGVTIKYATGFNAKFIETNKIGIGAIIKLIRSGDVIPFIQSVVQPAERAKMPLEDYHWNETNVDVIINNIDDNDDVKEKLITLFFSTLKVDGLSTGNVKRIINAGYKSIPSILKMTKKDFENVEGFKEKMINKVYNSIQENIAKATLLDIMVASNILGRGLGARKMKPILEQYPNILISNESNDQKIEMLKLINGIGIENSKSFVSNIPKFLTFLKQCNLENKLQNNILQIQTSKKNSKENSKKHILFDKHIVMTKVRDKDIIEKLKNEGGFLDDNVSKNTYVLIVKDINDISNKIKKAKELNIPIMIPSEFKDKYF